MTIQELIQATDWTLINSGHLEAPIEGVFVGDLLSYVMGNGASQQIWVTMQTHQNVLAIASLKEFSAVILVDGNTLEDEALTSAKDNELNVLSSPLPAYETIVKLVELGL